MKTAVIYYSYTGNTRAIALQEAKGENAALCEIKEIKKPGKLRAYSAGCFAALRMKGWAIEPLDINIEDYDKIIILSPVWAGHPAPAAISLLNMLPGGKTVEVVMVSMSGGSSAREKVEAIVRARGSELAGYRDVRN